MLYKKMFLVSSYEWICSQNLIKCSQIGLKFRKKENLRFGGGLLKVPGCFPIPIRPGKY